MALSAALAPSPAALPRFLPHGGKRQGLLRAEAPRRFAVAVLNDYEHFVSDATGPIEPVRPRFSREAFQSTGNPVIISPEGQGSQPKKKWRRGRKFKAATPEEAVAGAVISAVCTAGLWNGLQSATDYLASHPLAHNVPNNLTGAVNSCILSMAWGMGGLATSMFAMAAVGLSMLAVQTSQKVGKS